MTPFRNIQAITFDVGGTLIRPWPSVGHVYGEVAAEHGHKNFEPGMLNRQFAAAWRRKQNFDHSRRAWLELVEATFAGLIEENSVRVFFDDVYARFALADAWRVFDEVHPTLRELSRRRLKIAIISNWDERLRPLLAQLQLSPYFEVIVISGETGFAKPSLEIFARAASLLGVPHGSILHVGDTLTEDVVGAQSAGLQALLLDRKMITTGTSSVSSLAALSGLIETG